MTHPFHPLAGREFVLIDERSAGGEPRVYFEAPEGLPGSIPRAWTSRAPEDPLAVVAAGRAHFRVGDLLRVRRLLDALEQGEVSGYEENQQRLRESAARHGYTGQASPLREGPALVQGIALCGRCGRRMRVRYCLRVGAREPNYACCGAHDRRTSTACQHVAGAAVDRAVAALVIEAVNPLAPGMALDVQRELAAREDEADALRRKHVERARYEAELARRRYVQVDPDNRLVAGTLEAEWNAKLRSLAEAQDDYERRRHESRTRTDGQQGERVLALAADVPRLWNAETTCLRDRKRLLRLLIDDVTLLKTDQLMVHVRFRGGKTQTLQLPLPQPVWKACKTPPSVVTEVDRLLDDHADSAVARILDEQGRRNGKGLRFTAQAIRNLRRLYHLESRHARLRDAGMLTVDEMARQFGAAPQTIQRWRREGRLRAHAFSDKEYLFEPPGAAPPSKHERRSPPARRPARSDPSVRGGAV